MKSTDKAILFGRITVGKTAYMWPIATFNTPVSAKTYAAYIKMAHAGGMTDMAKRLDPETKLTEDGKLVPGLKMSVKVVPYEPTPASGAEEDDVEVEGETA